MDEVTQIRVIVVDDQTIVRSGLRTMLDAEPDIVVIGEARDGFEAVALSATERPDVVLMDIRMPELDGVSATRRIIDAGTAGAVLIITTFDDEEYLLESVRSGASGFLLKDAGPDLLAAAVRAAHRGEAIIDPGMTKSLLEHRLRADISASEPTGDDPRLLALATMSPREKDVLSALSRGLTNAEIAAELFVTDATVKTHISNVLVKSSTRSRVEAAVFAYETGFVRPGWLGG